MAVLQDKTKPTYEQLLEMVRIQREMLERPKNEISFKVNVTVKDPVSGEMKPGSRGLSIYGMGRRPLFAYASQWLRVLDHADQLRAFIEAHRSELAWKEVQ